MNKIFILALLLYFTASCTQPQGIGDRNLEDLQKEFLSWKFGMFIHYNMATYVQVGWATGKEDPLLFNPADLDFNQWADAAALAKMKYATLTIKHTGGWCLWDSKFTDHDIKMFTNYKGGKGDIVKEFTDAFQKKGIKVGLYYCFPLHDKKWANYSTLPVEGYEKGTADALGFIKNQFKELLTNYGKIDLIWVDQYASLNGGMKEGDWLKIKEYVHSLQPECLVIANNSNDLNQTDIVGYEFPWSKTLPPEGNTTPSEVCDKLQEGWFARVPLGEDPNPVVDADYIVNKMLIPLNNNNSNLLLNVAPNDRGLIPDSAVQILKEVGELW
ncbi:alpha-L-fucosidase [Bacteroidota bacterium]